MLRIGHGYDAHRFADISEQQAGIVLGGVEIPHSCSLLAHSDGDVLLHALCDALLGAMALGDIGKHFPDTDPQYKGIDSRELLRQVYAEVEKQQYQLVNADLSIIAQAPKMQPHIAKMCANISQCCKCGTGQINVKATTTEKMGFTGRKEGIACHAVVLLQKKSA